MSSISQSISPSISVQTEGQAQELVRWAATEDARLNIQGYNSKAGFGHAPTAGHDVTLKPLAGIIDYQPEELVMTVRAGTSLAEVEQALADKEQYLPFEPPHLGRLYYRGARATEASMGGVFMGNLAGPARLKNGAARDYLLGIRAVNGRGELYRAGGKVIKNVSGYDVCKLLAGSWGVLSIVTELSFKVLPASPCCTTLIIKDQDSAAAQQLFQAILSAPYEVSGLAYVPPGLTGLEGGCVYVRVQGSEASVQGRADAMVKELLSSHQYQRLSAAPAVAIWQTIRDIAPLADAGRSPVVMKLSIPPACMREVAAIIERLGGCLWYADAGGAWLWVGLRAARAAEKIVAIRRAVNERYGTAILYRAPEALKSQAGLYAMPDTVLQRINRGIKQAFDPQYLFNPGRLGGRHGDKLDSGYGLNHAH